MKKLISIILIISIAFTLASCANVEKPDWQTSLDLGQKYLLDGNYEQAIIEFNKVIEIDPKNVEAYIGLTEAYAAQGDYDSAIAVLEQGYAETGNQSLQNRINELRGLAASQTEAVTALPGTTTVPTRTEVITELDVESRKVKQAIFGNGNSAALTEDGNLYMWGANGCGQLGNSYVPVKIMGNVAFVSLGSGFSAAITTDGSLYMWGENGNGQLGNGTTEHSSVPIKIMDDVVSVSLGDFYSAAITKDGSLYMWGKNNHGQLGDGIGGDSVYRIEYIEGIDSNIPIKIMDNVDSVSLGNEYSAAITKDGGLYMWGANGYGQLGNGNPAFCSEVPIRIMDNVSYVSLGDNYSAAVTSDGSLYMWGYNLCGKLGNGTTEHSYVPVKIMDNVASVSLGWYHSAAITTDGSLYMWGYNEYGQLGNGTSGGYGGAYDYNYYYEGIDSNVPIKIMDNVASVSLGDYYSAAITTDGSLYMWGQGSLGNGMYYDDSSVPIKIMDNIVSVSLSLGFGGSAAITSDGSLYMWGNNTWGQLGNGTTGDGNVPIKVEIPVE